jgi:hypothetical protein
MFVKAERLLKRGAQPGDTARNLSTLMFAYADAQRLDDAIRVARIEFREDDRSRALEAFTAVLVDAGRLDDAWNVAHAIVGTTQRAEALLTLALAEASKEPEKSRALLGEIRDLVKTDERPDRKASVLTRLVRGFLALGLVEQAITAAEMIPLHAFRANAFRMLAHRCAANDASRAATFFERALGEAEAIQDERERQQILSETATTIAEVDGIRRGLGVLQCASFDDFIITLARWAPFLEREDGTSPAKAVRETIAIAAWTRRDWREIDERLRGREGPMQRDQFTSPASE